MSAIEFVTSKDGTKIAFTRSGAGPPIVFVDGAMCRRDFGPAKPLAALLKHEMTVVLLLVGAKATSGFTTR